MAVNERRIQATITIFLDDTTVHAIVNQGDAYSQHESQVFDHQGLVHGHDMSQAEAMLVLMRKVGETLNKELAWEEQKRPTSG